MVGGGKNRRMEESTTAGQSPNAHDGFMNGVDMGGFRRRWR